jgi:hypothetical protein
MEDLPLRDIHLPAPINWWPPAVGWWGLMVLILALIFGIALYRRYLNRPTLAKLALKELGEIEFSTDLDQVEKVRSLSILMKRYALSHNNRYDVAGLTGPKWLAWLDLEAGDTRFSHGVGRLLLEAPYRPLPPNEDMEELFSLCRAWFERKTRATRFGEGAKVKRRLLKDHRVNN